MKNYRRLTVIIPDLLPYQQSAGYESLAESQPHSLVKLLKMGKSTSSACSSFNELLKNVFQFSPNEPFPVAAITAKAFNLDGTHWLRADPSQLRADLAGVYLLGSAHLAMQPDELALLMPMVRTFLQEENIHLYVLQEDVWLLQFPEKLLIQTSPPHEVIGKEISPYLPIGNDRDKIRLLFTQLQMLLHANPVNIAREQEGRPTINGLWLWGEGELPIIEPSVYSDVMTNEPLSLGVAKHMHIPYHEQVTSLTELLQNSPNKQNMLVVDTTLMQHWQRNDLVAWQAYRTQLDNQWFTPLLAALQNKVFDEIILYPSFNQAWVIRQEAWYSRLWRKLKG